MTNCLSVSPACNHIGLCGCPEGGPWFGFVHYWFLRLSPACSILAAPCGLNFGASVSSSVNWGCSPYVGFMHINTTAIGHSSWRAPMKSLPVRGHKLNYCVERRKELDSPYHKGGLESSCQCRGQGFDTWSGEIPHATEQLSP